MESSLGKNGNENRNEKMKHWYKFKFCYTKQMYSHAVDKFEWMAGRTRTNRNKEVRVIYSNKKHEVVESRDHSHPEKL